MGPLFERGILPSPYQMQQLVSSWPGQAYVATPQNHPEIGHMSHPNHQYHKHVYQLRALAKPLQAVLYCHHPKAEQTDL